MNPLLSHIADSFHEIVECDNAMIRAADLRFRRDTLPLLRDTLGESGRFEEVLDGISALVGDVELSAYLRGIQDFAGLLRFNGSRPDIPGD